MTAVSQFQLFTLARSEPIRWRLLSGNNRESGRSAVTFVDEDEALAGIDLLRARASDLAAAVRRFDAHRWTWVIRLDGAPVAGTSHTFDRSIRCEQAAARFIASLPMAGVRSGLLISAARRWGSVA